MINIDDNDFKLLKMLVSLLKKSLSNEIVQKALEDYQELACKIDAKIYNKYIDEVSHYRHDLSLISEIEYLDKIENSYNELNELQCKLKDIYRKYSFKELELSNLELIDITKIRDRKNVISGYLINLKNIKSCEDKLASLNKEFTQAEEINESNHRQYERLERELKTSFLKAEGRYPMNEGKFRRDTYTSVAEEYKDNQLDLLTLFKENTSLDKLCKETENLRVSLEEMLRAGQICYDKIPSEENKEIIENLEKETNQVRYRLILLRIVKLIVQKEDSYTALLEKREKLLSLIQNRAKCLEKMGKKFTVDPFTRIKVQEQLDYIHKSLSDKQKTIKSIRKEISDVSNRLEELTDNRCDFLKEIDMIPSSFIQNSTRFSDIVQTNLPVDEISKKVADNQVISLKELSKKFNRRIVNEKTQKVIQRVMEILSLYKEVQDESSQLFFKEKKDVQEDNLLKNFFEITSILKSLKPTESNAPTFLQDKENIFKDNADSPFIPVRFYPRLTEEGNSNILDGLPELPDNLGNSGFDGKDKDSKSEKRLKLVA